MGGSAGGAGAGGAGSGGTAGGGAGSGGATNCMTPPAPSTLIGWATNGTGTTGGGTATPTVVTSASQLMTAIGGTNAAVIHVNGNISGSFSIGSNKTIIGVCGATIQGDIHLNRSTNVILRNLKVVGRNCTDSPQDCSAGEDAVSVNGAANHLWFDHLDVSNGSDGNLDVTQGSDFVTISWTKFSYSSKRTDPMAGASGHRFSNLVGASDTDASDVGHLNITYHHNWWADNVDQRMPRTRRGNIHVLNNLYTSSGNSYCTDAGQDAKLLVENNVYIGVNNPLEVRNNGTLRSVGNLFTMTTGTTSGSGNGFTPTYQYTADPTTGLEQAIRTGAGPH
jgi:pectate lyase